MPRKRTWDFSLPSRTEPTQAEEEIRDDLAEEEIRDDLPEEEPTHVPQPPGCGKHQKKNRRRKENKANKKARSKTEQDHWIEINFPALKGAQFLFYRQPPFQMYAQKLHQLPRQEAFLSLNLASWSPICEPTLIHVQDILQIGVLWQVESLKVHREQILSVLRKVPSFRPHLPHGTRLSQAGHAFGIGFRAGYAKGGQTGVYQPLHNVSPLEEKFFVSQAASIPPLLD